MPKQFLCILAFLATSCGLVAEERDWSFVQSVGGIAVGQPSKKAAEWVLPVRADVSGTQTITIKPTVLNGALVCTSVPASIEGKAIYITIKTGFIRSGLGAVCPPARLGNIKLGSYAVLYRETGGRTISLGEVTVGP
jgi:hypothetical protein